jgi:hypothetical protein
MTSDDTFAYILDTGLVRDALADWPEGMVLAVCLQADGGCKMVVGHESEGSQILRRVAVAVERDARSFAVAPAVDGWPTRRVRFSEEQDILNMVAEAPELVQVATDYAEARHQPEVAAPAPAQAAAPAPDPAPQPSVMSQVKQRLHLGLGAVRRPATPDTGMPPGFAPLDSPSRAGCQFATGTIGGHGAGVRVAVSPDKISIQTEPKQASKVGFSADFRHFYLPRDVLKGWKPGRAAIIDIPADQFPESLRNAFLGRKFHLDVTVTSEGVFLTHGPALPAEQTPVSESKRRWRLPLRAAAAILVALGAGGAALAVMTGTGAPEMAELLAAALP